MLNSILSGGESSRLPQRLVRKDKIALFSAGQPYTRQGPGIFIYFAVYFPHIKPEKIESTIIDELDNTNSKLSSFLEEVTLKKVDSGTLNLSLESLNGTHYPLKF